MQQTIKLEMDNQGRPDFYVVFSMSLCTLVETNINKFAISNHAGLKLCVYALIKIPQG